MLTDDPHPSDTRPRIALIGAGAIASTVAELCAGRSDGLRIAAALVCSPSKAQLFEGIALFTYVDVLLDWRPDLVVECAGHEAVRTVVPVLLDNGVDASIGSVGVLQDTDLYDRLRDAAEHNGARLILPSGAVGGLDALQAASRAVLSEVVYTGQKPPLAWKGTPAEVLHDLDRISEPTVLFEGSAADAARLYPKNANVVMAVALAGVGPTKTQVRLIANPGSARNQHEIQAVGAFGKMRFTIANHPLPANPKSSMLAALSIVHTIGRWHAAVVIG